MKPIARPRRILVAATFLLLSAGCGSGTGSFQPVHGTVSYQNKPLTCGTIVFTPDASRGHAGPIAWSAIKSDGSYSLRTEKSMGASPGWYRVTVSAVEMAAQPEAGERYAVPHSLVPERYRDPDLGDLVREVVPGRASVINLNLE
jgi:hypothetical protein